MYCWFRLRDLEREYHKQKENLSQCKHAIKALKTLVTTSSTVPSIPNIPPHSPILPTQPSISSEYSTSSSTPAPSSIRSKDRSSDYHFNNTTATSLPNKQKVSVNIDAALGQLLSSLDELALPVQSTNTASTTTTIPSSIGDAKTWSLTEIDDRLVQLQQQKEELRKKLLSEM
jgi:hypothetical protein